MERGDLPDGKTYVRGLLVHTAVFVLAAIAVISLYLTGLLRLAPDRWRGFCEIVAAVLGLIFPAMVLVHWPIFQRIRTCLDRRALGSATPAELRAGFAAVADFPRYWFAWGLGWWALGGVLVGLGMWLRYDDFGASSAGVVIAATVSAAFVTDIYYFLTIKRRLEPVRRTLAAEIGGPAERRALAPRVSLRAKLLVALTSVILVTAVYAALLARARTQRALEQSSLAGAERLVDAAARGEVDLDAARREAERYAVAARVALLAAEAGAVLDGALGERELAAIRAAGPDGGADCPAGAGTCVAWRRRGDGLVIAAATGAIAPPQVHLGFAALVVLSTAVAMGAAMLLAQDVGRITTALRRRAERVAAGDLSGGEPVESEDELGDLAYAFEGMERSLADVVARVARAADGLQAAAGEIAGAAESASRVAAEQASALGEASAATVAIDEQVHGISRSAEGLTGAMHEATSAIFELDATSGELGANADQLSVSLDEVTAAIERLVRSIGLVARNADELASVSNDASSSTTQTAETVRQTDESAGEMARLATQVVGLADQGRERVRGTLRGMQEIREASQAADQVIRGLAERTRAVGAILDVIDDVADETNLLALNAAIIAAQAGEHGRSFSVVADEIKALAERVLESTKEIAALIRAVQGEAEEAKAAVGRGGDRVGRGVELAGEADTSLEEITLAARESGARVAEIAGAAGEQAEAVRHLAELMDRVRGSSAHIREAIWEQGRNTGLLRQSAGQAKSVSQRVATTTQEQVRSAGLMKHGMQSIRQATDDIDSALRDQAAACRSASDRLRLAAQGTDAHREVARRLEASVLALRTQAEELRSEVRRFRI